MSIKVGKFTLELLQFDGLPPAPDEIWISTDSGEAGAFNLDSFEDVIKTFYEENF